MNQSFELWNSGAGTLSYSISDNAAWLSCSPVSGSSTGEHDTISVAYNTASLAAGLYSANITITAAGAANSPKTLPVTLTVTGLTFDGTHLWHADYGADRIYKLDLSGNVLDSFKSPGGSPMCLVFDGKDFWLADSTADMIRKFYETPGSVEAGSSKNRTFTLTSSGDADLEIGNLYITGTDASNFVIQNDTCSGQTITPGGQCTVDIAFSPVSGTKKSADLEIPSNDADMPILSVPLDSLALEFQGDFDGDGDVDGKDVMELALNFNPSILSQLAAGFGR